MAKIQLPVRIEQDDLEILKELAKTDNRPLSNYVATFLKNHISSMKCNHDMQPDNEYEDINTVYVCTKCGFVSKNY